MYPDRVPAESVIEVSDIANKENMIDQLNPPMADLRTQEHENSGTQKVPAQSKAKKLKSLLISQKAMRKMRSPYLEPYVFLSYEQADCRLPDYLQQSVYIRDRDATAGQPERPGIVAALTRWTAENARLSSMTPVAPTRH